MIELKNITKIYQGSQPLTALHNVNLSVKRGEIYGIVGKSGAGKSTLLHCVNMLEIPTEGDVFVAGECLTKLPLPFLRKIRQKIGMIFQHFNLLARRTVFENIALPLQFNGASQQHIESKILPLLELVGLSDKIHFYPHQLSGGQKQRVAIARALANEPFVLLCDEATSALDPETTHSILQLLKNINQKLGLTILLITHELEVLKQICDRVALLYQGEVIEEASVLEFFTHAKTKITQDFIKTNRKELPDAIQRRIITETDDTGHPIYRIAFRGHSAAEPIISMMGQTYQLLINILQANIEFIHDEIVGFMLVEIRGDTNAITQGIDYLKSKGLNVENIGHVTSDLLAVN